MCRGPHATDSTSRARPPPLAAEGDSEQPCEGLPGINEVWQWFRDTARVKKLSDPRELLHSDGGTLRSRYCTGGASGGRQYCDACGVLWVRAGTGKTQGSEQGVVYTSVKQWQRVRTCKIQGLPALRAGRRQSRRSIKSRLQQEISQQNKTSLARFSPALLSFCTQVAGVVGKHHLPESFLEQQAVHIKNVWREGKAVHGRRYPTGVADTVLALSSVAHQKQATQLCGLLAVNSMVALAGRLTLNRRIVPVISPCFGVQPESTFVHMAELFPEKARALHICNDEVAVNHMIEHIPHPEGGLEIAGLANRCIREKNPVGVQYILHRQSATLTERKTCFINGEISVADTVHPLSFVEDVSSKAPATLLCLWIIFDPTHRGRRLFVAAVPTKGDLTVNDDATTLHGVIKAAMKHGRDVSFYGADNASPHAALSRGIVRTLTTSEAKAIREAVKAAIEEGCLRVPEVEEGSSTVDMVKPWEAVAVGLVPLLHRPISIVQRLLALEHAAGDKTRPDLDLVRQKLTPSQWLVPYPGLPYAMHYCGLTGKLLGLSCEWRHTLRLLVRSANSPCDGSVAYRQTDLGVMILI